MSRVGKGSWAGQPMTLGNMRELGVQRLFLAVGYILNDPH